MRSLSFFSLGIATYVFKDNISCEIITGRKEEFLSMIIIDVSWLPFVSVAFKDSFVCDVLWYFSQWHFVLLYCCTVAMFVSFSRYLAMFVFSCSALMSMHSFASKALFTLDHHQIHVVFSTDIWISIHSSRIKSI